MPCFLMPFPCLYFIGWKMVVFGVLLTLLGELAFLNFKFLILTIIFCVGHCRTRYNLKYYRIYLLFCFLERNITVYTYHIYTYTHILPHILKLIFFFFFLGNSILFFKGKKSILVMTFLFFWERY